MRSGNSGERGDRKLERRASLGGLDAASNPQTGIVLPAEYRLLNPNRERTCSGHENGIVPGT